MNEIVVSIDKAGRIVLPKGVREELAINPGDLLKISVQGDQVTLSPDRAKAGFVKRGGALIFSTGETDLLENETVEAVRRDAREALTTNISKGLSRKRK